MNKKEQKQFEDFLKKQGAWEAYANNMQGYWGQYEVLDFDPAQAHQAITYAFDWNDVPEGATYWRRIANKLIATLSRPGDILPDYDIYLNKQNGDLYVGCQTITKKGQKKLFKILAKQLGYEIQG